jgi:hypothetical protein
MNQQFKQISLAVGGSHYPSINPQLQQRFGEEVVKRIVNRIENEIDIAFNQNEVYATATLQALVIEILNDFDLEIFDNE